jgi:hypothetical protein
MKPVHKIMTNKMKRTKIIAVEVPNPPTPHAPMFFHHLLDDVFYNMQEMNIVLGFKSHIPCKRIRDSTQ